MQTPARDWMNSSYPPLSQAHRRRRTLDPLIALMLGIFALSDSAHAANDIIIDGTTYADGTVFGNQTATTSVIFENNPTIGVATGDVLNLAGVNNAASL